MGTLRFPLASLPSVEKLWLHRTEQPMNNTTTPHNTSTAHHYSTQPQHSTTA